MSDLKRWHVTHVGSDKAPMIWKLEGSQAVAFGFSVGVAFFVFRALASAFEWSVWIALPAAGMIPAATLLVLFTLVRGKPKGHLERWVEWQVLKATSEELLVERPDHLESIRELLDRLQAFLQTSTPQQK